MRSIELDAEAVRASRKLSQIFDMIYEAFDLLQEPETVYFVHVDRVPDERRVINLGLVNADYCLLVDSDGCWSLALRPYHNIFANVIKLPFPSYIAVEILKRITVEEICTRLVRKIAEVSQEEVDKLEKMAAIDQALYLIIQRALDNQGKA